MKLWYILFKVILMKYTVMNAKIFKIIDNKIINAISVLVKI